MARVAVVGGHGKVARLLHLLLLRAGHTPVALVRDEAYRHELEALGAEVRLLDVEKETALEFAGLDRAAVQVPSPVGCSVMSVTQT